ncbi:MAG TPA: cobalamin-independent methionine synthase II family protein [Solirubrobacteraceae bacterium]|nr:cobalamin-independent methionine synthase II family protein [Solirubrobacteraceae bacterium]
MRPSADRILTTHVGSLARPTELLDLMRSRALGESYDTDSYHAAVREAVTTCVREQAASGLDTVSDGEQGKIGHATYIGERLAGFEPRSDGQSSVSALFRAEIEEFPEYYEEYFNVAMLGGAVAPTAELICTGPVSYTGLESLQRDLENLRSAVDALGDDWSGQAFMPAIAPSGAGGNEYYSTEQEYLFAVADALQSEYEAIVAAGFLLQIDDPFLSEIYSDPLTPIENRRERGEAYVEAINRGLRNIPEDKVRFHTCYGINEGPRVHDIALGEIVELVLRVQAGAYSFEAGNPRHEHEYHVWESARLPDGKVIMPGVITHSTNIVEHPELIAERIVRFAERVGRENVIAGADCGFASQASYKPEVHPTVVWAKFRALAEGARIATQRLW